MMAWCFAIWDTPIASVTVKIAGNPAGMALTASATASLNTGLRDRLDSPDPLVRCGKANEQL